MTYLLLGISLDPLLVDEWHFYLGGNSLFKLVKVPIFVHKVDDGFYGRFVLEVIQCTHTYIQYVYIYIFIRLCIYIYMYNIHMHRLSLLFHANMSYMIWIHGIAISLPYPLDLVS